MVRMGVGLQHPLGAPAALLHRLDQPVRPRGAGASGLDVEIQHRIDDGADARVRIGHDVAVALGRIVEKAEDGRRGHEVRSPVMAAVRRTGRTQTAPAIFRRCRGDWCRRKASVERTDFARRGQRFIWDTELPGFGLCIGTKSKTPRPRTNAVAAWNAIAAWFTVCTRSAKCKL